ncbi:uncharacterized protein LOC119459075 [Dermacentor silvarum]|uniref:uncharacterized protein LOC119459075 n=1 Tax=Dermacentor silvarum TaxID=543639 RepID=UPI0021007AAF|nr:uncharacterized protein LOC119459075 [Dermacentor silvarum]
MPSDNQLSAFLAACGSRFARQTAKGKKFTEEGYVRNIMFNNLCSTSPYGLLRSICLPSMKGGYYIVHAVIEKGTGDILAGHCLCPAGLSGSCQHVVGLLLTACNLAPQGEDTTCTDVPCAWIVPPQAKKQEPSLPLSEILFESSRNRKRVYDPTPGLLPADPANFISNLQEISPSCLLLRYAKKPRAAEESTTETIAAKVINDGCCNQPYIADSEDLLSMTNSRIIQERFDAIQPLSLDDRAVILESTMGQAENKKWHQERIGRLTASVFKKLLRCRKPDGAVRDVMYPRQVSTEAMRYGRIHEDDAVKAYEEIMACRDSPVNVTETGLRIHKQYPFLAASPDRIVVLHGEQGLLEVKCPFSKKGMTAEDASKDSKFCCMLKDGQIQLKQDHAYYYQVQGQMATTGHKWCDFVIWTKAQKPNEMHHIHVERIFFDQSFWESDMLPAILHFMQKSFIAEVLRRHVR